MTQKGCAHQQIEQSQAVLGQILQPQTATYFLYIPFQFGCPMSVTIQVETEQLKLYPMTHSMVNTCGTFDLSVFTAAHVVGQS